MRKSSNVMRGIRHKTGISLGRITVYVGGCGATVGMHVRRWASRFKSESDPTASGESSNTGSSGKTGTVDK